MIFPLILLALAIPPLDEFGEDDVERKPEVVTLDGYLERAGLSGIYSDTSRGYSLQTDTTELGPQYHTLFTVHEKQDEYMRHLVKVASKLGPEPPRVFVKGWHVRDGNREFILVISIKYKPPPPQEE